MLTEVPNLLIKMSSEPAKKERKAVLKRPAACSPAGIAHADDGRPVRRIGLEYYKRNSSFGVRERDGMKRSLLKVRCSTMAKEQLQIIADEARRRLAQGDDIAEVIAILYAQI